MGDDLAISVEHLKGLGLDVSVGHFDSTKKSEFLGHLRTLWPKISRCCRAVGISTQTYYNHLASDVKFCKAVAEIKATVLEELEATAVESGLDKQKGFLDRAMILRAHRPELYDRAKVVKIEGYKMGAGEKSQRLGAVGEAIDAEIVNSYTTRQERRRLKGSGGAGDSNAKP